MRDRRGGCGGVCHGRVQTEAALLGKLIAYDTAPAGGSWPGKAMYIADNANGAGDVASFAALSALLGSQPGSRSSACTTSPHWTRGQ